MARLEWSSTRRVVVLIVGLTSVVLAVSGYGIGALILLGGVGVVVVVRRHGPETAVHVVQYAEHFDLAHSCDAVWALIKPAENAHLLDPRMRRGFHVPGTPLGLGEQQAFELLDGTTTVIEVVEYDPNRRAVTRQVSPAQPLPMRVVHSLNPVSSGCRYTFGYEIDAPDGLRVDPGNELAIRSTIREHHESVARILASSNPGTATTPP